MNSMKIQYLERKSEEMHLSGQTAEHRCWHGDYSSMFTIYGPVASSSRIKSIQHARLSFPFGTQYTAKISGIR